MNEEPATVALRKFRLQKNVKTRYCPITVAGLIKIVQRFEEIGSCKVRRTQSKANTFSAIFSRNGNIRVRIRCRTNNAREAGKRLGLPPSSVHNILHGVLNQYPYKLQSDRRIL
ncbi:hypothetical protein NPIL_286741 [Nephila pilipes]|uniref:DUF4817 domain-containing protein n=1 Tax=Nephila pilipes TaxID=299642 RepID=A0A8X6QYX4_NEPPI|nr:hypothetical protein NPIL_286741 [Nephila pilipes]